MSIGKLPLYRRTFLGGAAALAVSGPAFADPDRSRGLSVVANSPFMCNGVAVSKGGSIFLGLPRFPGMEHSPAVARVLPDGSIAPFPGGQWNRWQPGRDTTNAFVMVNALHIFRDGTLWVVDQGALAGETPEPGAQKLVQLDATSGRVLRVLRFADSVMPSGAQFNDLRIAGHLMFVTDSGLGGVIIHNLKTGQTLRRLSRHSVMRNVAARPQRGSEGRILHDAHGKRPDVNSDDIEVDATGTWFYFSVPAGPMRKIRVSDLMNTELSDVQLAQRVTLVGEIPSIGGTCIDTRDNLYFSDAEHNAIFVVGPDGQRETLVQDDRLVSPDALFIDAKRTLFIPCPQIQKLAMFDGGNSMNHPPFQVFSLPLPERIGNISLGRAVAG